MILPQFTAPGYGDRTLNEVQRCVNWYPEKTASGWELISTPGLSLLATVANNFPSRGAHYTSTGRLYSANDDDLYELTLLGATDVGNLLTSSGRVCFCDNGTYMLIVDSTDGYVLTLATNTLTTITDVNFPANPNGCVFRDGYFIVTETDSDVFYLSAIGDPLDWTPQTFAQAESSGDSIRGCICSGNEVLFLGARTIEPWYFTGNSSFPLERITGSIMRIGVDDMETVAIDGNTVYMVASADSVDPSAWAITAGSARKISTPDIDDKIIARTYDRAFIYQKSGHTFYQINLFASSLVYDITEGVWHERDSDVSSSYVANRIVYAINRDGNFSGTIGLDRVNGNYYTIQDAPYTENGTAIRRIKDWTVGDGVKILFHDRIEIVAEITDSNDSSYTASGTLSWSDDGGLTFNTPITLSATVAAAVGFSGQMLRFTNNRMGSSRKRTYRWIMTTSARIILKTCDMKIRVGSN